MIVIEALFKTYYRTSGTYIFMVLFVIKYASMQPMWPGSKKDGKSNEEVR